MKVLLDTNVFLWLSIEPGRIAPDRLLALRSWDDDVLFSAVSLWELTIKFGRGRPRLSLDIKEARRAFLDQGYLELAITADHALAVADLPPIHRDPFDRMLAAQAKVENAALATADRALARYPVPIFAV